MDFIKRQAIRTAVGMISPMILEVLPEFISWLSDIKKNLKLNEGETEPIFTIFESGEKLIVSIVIIDESNRITRQLVNFDLSVVITNLDKIINWFFDIKKKDQVPSIAQAVDFYNTLKIPA
jgi:hypothetical protein